MVSTKFKPGDLVVANVKDSGGNETSKMGFVLGEVLPCPSRAQYVDDFYVNVRPIVATEEFIKFYGSVGKIWFADRFIKL